MNIRDIHKIKTLVDDVESLKNFKTAFPLMRPFLKLLGVDTSRIEDTFSDYEDLSKKVLEMSAIPDRFNDTFASMGWILFERMDFEVAKEALSKAEAGDIDGAEQILIDYFSPGYVSLELNTMNAVEAFRPRMELARMALSDYEAGRYYACIPVILAQIDGLVSELNERQRGFFAEDINLEAWDSLAAHSKGLNQLSNIFRKGRRKTTTEQIDVPYRHGILHGRDLGYANIKVAAKTWAALFAVREWAIKAERDELDAPPPEPEIGWKDILNNIAEHSREKKRWEEWTPRQFNIQGVETNPSPSEFTEGMPERAISEYLQWWHQANYGYMANYIPFLFVKYAEKPVPAMVRDVYEGHKLNSYELLDIEHSAAGLAEITAKLSIEQNDAIVQNKIQIRMVFEDENGDMVAQGNPSGKWVVMNWRAIPS